jgi:UDP-glucose 4-epimerase
MTVLVTGGAGYIGSHTVWDLIDAGEEVVVLDNLSTGFRWAVAPEAELVDGNIGDQALVDRLIAERGIDAIIHFAGSVVVPESVADPLGYYLNNTVRSRALIESAVKGGVPRFVFSSTAAVYGMTGEEPVGEDAPKQPISPYGRSKLMTEIMLTDAAAAHDIRFVALRYFNVAGSDPKGRTGQSTRGATHLIKVAAEAALGKRPGVQVFGTDYPTPDGTGVRDFIHVTDLSRAHLAALAYLGAGGDSLIANCGYGHGYSVLEVLGAVERVSGRKLGITYGPRRPGDPASVISDPALIRRSFDWSPEYDDLDFIVKTALAWEESLDRRNQFA